MIRIKIGVKEAAFVPRPYNIYFRKLAPLGPLEPMTVVEDETWVLLWGRKLVLLDLDGRGTVEYKGQVWQVDGPTAVIVRVEGFSVLKLKPKKRIMVANVEVEEL